MFTEKFLKSGEHGEIGGEVAIEYVLHIDIALVLCISSHSPPGFGTDI